MFLTKLNRVILLRRIQRPVQLATFSNEGHSSSDDEKNKNKSPKKPESKKDDKKADTKVSAADKLNSLLASMNTEDSLSNLSKTVQIPQARGGKKQKRTKDETKSSTAKKEESIEEAAKDVANFMGGKTKQTEADLLSKVLGHIDGGITIAAKAGDGQSLSDIIGSMKVDRTKKKEAAKPFQTDFVDQTTTSYRARGRGDFDEQNERFRRPRRPRPLERDQPREKIDLFGQRLGIFTEPEKLKESPDILPVWKFAREQEIKQSVTHPPKNYFQKMQRWTEKGLIWQFPIDNEQGLDEEAKVDFTEHIFLEQHLEGWCPQRGPIRHFMELVCVGLSKNPYITAQEKKEHIIWYRDYFEAKKDLLKQVIIDQKSLESETKEIEK